MNLKIISNIYRVSAKSSVILNNVSKFVSQNKPLYAFRIEGSAVNVILTDRERFMYLKNPKEQFALQERVTINILPKTLHHKNFGTYNVIFE